MTKTVLPTIANAIMGMVMIKQFYFLRALNCPATPHKLINFLLQVRLITIKVCKIKTAPTDCKCMCLT